MSVVAPADLASSRFWQICLRQNFSVFGDFCTTGVHIDCLQLKVMKPILAWSDLIVQHDQWYDCSQIWGWKSSQNRLQLDFENWNDWMLKIEIQYIPNVVWHDPHA